MADVLRFFDEAQIAIRIRVMHSGASDHPIWRDRVQRPLGPVAPRRRVRSPERSPALFVGREWVRRCRCRLLTDDPPRHTQLRSIVNKAFTTAMLKSMEPDIAAIANDLIGALPDGRDVDIVDH